MADLGGMVGPLAFVYSAALAGAVASGLVRVGTRRPLALVEAGWGVFLPLFSVVLFSLVALTLPHRLAPFEPLHAQWHQWEATIHGSRALHGLLHGANWLVLAAGCWLVGRTVFAGSRIYGFERSLHQTAQPTADPGVYLLPSSRLLCFTVGLLRPRIYATTALWDQLTLRDRQVVLAHEQAHARRRDTLMSAGLTLFYLLLPLPGSCRLLKDWYRAVERTCDADAAQQIGSACDVAAALVRVAQLVGRSSAVLPNSACFAQRGEDVEGRVHALLALGQARHQTNRVVVGVLGAMGLALVGSAALCVPHLVDLFVHH